MTNVFELSENVPRRKIKEIEWEIILQKLTYLPTGHICSDGCNLPTWDSLNDKFEWFTVFQIKTVISKIWIILWKFFSID